MAVATCAILVSSSTSQGLSFPIHPLSLTFVATPLFELSLQVPAWCPVHRGICLLLSFSVFSTYGVPVDAMHSGCPPFPGGSVLRAQVSSGPNTASMIVSSRKLMITRVPFLRVTVLEATVSDAN